MIVVRYADDFIIGFEYESEARRFLDEMRERLGKFALTLHPEKTRLIEIGRFAAERRKRRGLGKPETFNFLGFTFICGTTRAGKFQIKRKTRRDRMRAKLKMIKEEMWKRMHQPIPAQGKWLRQVVQGYFNYHAVPTNGRALHVFRHHVTDLWRRTLRRRSQKDRFTWARMSRLVDDWLPKPIILHPWPSERFAVTHPRWEPYAGKPHVRFYAGGAMKRTSLPLQRREFIMLLGGAAVAWPLVARAQQGERMRRIGVLMNLAADDSLGQARQTTFVQGATGIGLDRRPQRADRHSLGRGRRDRYRKYAAELVALAPDVMLAASGATMPALMQATVPCRSCLCRFPIRSAPASSRAWPGWQRHRVYPVRIRLKQEMAGGAERDSAFCDASGNSSGFRRPCREPGSSANAAPSFGIEVRPVDLRDPGEIERGIKAFASVANGGLIVTGSTPSRGSPAPAHARPSRPISRRCATANGWSTASAHSGDPSRCCAISCAIPTASPSPTAV